MKVVKVMDLHEYLHDKQEGNEWSRFERDLAGLINDGWEILTTLSAEHTKWAAIVFVREQ